MATGNKNFKYSLWIPEAYREKVTPQLIRDLLDEHFNRDENSLEMRLSRLEQRFDALMAVIKKK